MCWLPVLGGTCRWPHRERYARAACHGQLAANAALPPSRHRHPCRIFPSYRRLKGKQPPEGWELIEEVVEDFEAQMKDAVNEDTSGKRRNETTWKVRALSCRGGGAAG